MRCGVQSRAYPGGVPPGPVSAATGIRRAVSTISAAVVFSLLPLTEPEEQPV